MANGTIYCHRCGAQNSALAKFCSNCGTPFQSEAQSLLAAPEVMSRPQGPTAPAPSAYTDATSTAFPSPVNTRPYGGFWVRLVAFIIDAIAIGIVTVPGSAVIGFAVSLAGRAIAMPDLGVWMVRLTVGLVFSGLANWIYEAALESSSYQATLGKMALGLKVTDLAGQRISFTRATGRHFAKILSTMTFLIGYVMAGFNSRKQALHDIIARTLVRTQ